MKQIILLAMVMLFSVTSFAQTIRVTNNTNCRIIFTVNLYNTNCSSYSSGAMVINPMTGPVSYGISSFSWTPSGSPSGSFALLKYGAANAFGNVCSTGGYPFSPGCNETATIGNGSCAPASGCVEVSAACALCDIGTTITGTFSTLAGGNASVVFN